MHHLHFVDLCDICAAQISSEQLVNELEGSEHPQVGGQAIGKKSVDERLTGQDGIEV